MAPNRLPSSINPEFAVIGGSGLTHMPDLEIVHRQVLRTQWGEPSAPLTVGRLGNATIAFLPRHGQGHSIAPHRVNYRANIQALADVGISRIIAVTAVGGIRSDLAAGTLVLPHDVLDYTWGRDHSFYAGASTGSKVVHVDFTEPYNRALRDAILLAGRDAGIDLVDGAVYAATQGPRFESVAEIDRIERDGGDIVGMTGMPEASLARELDIAYANISIVVNPAAGRCGEDQPISLEQVFAELEAGVGRVRQLLAAAGPGLAKAVTQ